MDPHKRSQLIFDNGAKTIQWRVKIVFSTNEQMVLEQPDIYMQKKKQNLDTDPSQKLTLVFGPKT